MKKVLFIALAIAAVTTVSAQKKEEKKGKGETMMSVGAEVGLPIGSLGDINGIGFGASVKAAFPVSADGAITGSAGYMTFSGKTISILGISVKNSALGMIPIKAGYRHMLGGGFNVEPQVGYTLFSGSGSGGGFTYAANVGYMINNQWDLSARYEGISNNGSVSFIGARVGYNFSLKGK